MTYSSRLLFRTSFTIEKLLLVAWILKWRVWPFLPLQLTYLLTKMSTQVYCTTSWLEHTHRTIPNVYNKLSTVTSELKYHPTIIWRWLHNYISAWWECLTSLLLLPQMGRPTLEAPPSPGAEKEQKQLCQMGCLLGMLLGQSIEHPSESRLRGGSEGMRKTGQRALK